MESSELHELIVAAVAGSFYFMHRDPGEVASLLEHHTTHVHLNRLSAQHMALHPGAPLLHCLSVLQAVWAAGVEMTEEQSGWT